MCSTSPAFLAVTFVTLAATTLLLIQGHRTRNRPHVLDAVMKRLAHVERMLPRTPAELALFRALSLTAGFCEELLYRGFLMWYLGHWLGLVPSLALVSLLFGLGHSYQGVRGVVTTGLVGVVLGLVYLLAGSLVPAMILHAVGDLHSGNMAYAALNRQHPETERPPD